MLFLWVRVIKETFRFFIIHLLSIAYHNLLFCGLRLITTASLLKSGESLNDGIFCSLEMLIDTHNSFRELFPKGKISSDTIKELLLKLASAGLNEQHSYLPISKGSKIEDDQDNHLVMELTRASWTLRTPSLRELTPKWASFASIPHLCHEGSGNSTEEEMEKNLRVR